MLMRYRILCDCCCDFSATEKLSSDFEKIPAIITISATSLTDDKHLRQEILLAALQTKSLALQLKYPTEDDFLRAMDCGAQEVYVVCATTAAGEHYELACQARRQLLQVRPDAQIHVFNSRSAGAGELLVARKISHMQRSGCSFQQIVDGVERYCLQTQTFFLTGEEQLLRETGLAKRKKHPIFLHARQMIWADIHGNLEELDSAATDKGLEKKLLKQLQKYGDQERKTCFIGHYGAPERARRIAQMLRHAGMYRDIVLIEMGGVSSLMLGRGGITVACGA